MRACVHACVGVLTVIFHRPFSIIHSNPAMSPLESQLGLLSVVLLVTLYVMNTQVCGCAVHLPHTQLILLVCAVPVLTSHICACAVIGQKVNMAARLMMKYPNAITCDQTSMKASNISEQMFTLLPPPELKGISQPEDVFSFTTDRSVHGG